MSLYGSNEDELSSEAPPHHDRILYIRSDFLSNQNACLERVHFPHWDIVKSRYYNDIAILRYQKHA